MSVRLQFGVGVHETIALMAQLLRPLLSLAYAVK